MTSEQIRQQFLDFFASKEHVIVPSSSVVPLDDPTLMFTNAGMNQFKDVFLGTGTRSFARAADTQKCIRAGGKHNDLDDVGRDTYHHTFFEMLGNWSFGDYFKKEAIRWAWELLTEVWGIDKTRLHATYFEGDEADGLAPDAEAAELWRTETDIDPEHIHPGNKKDNFWEMGDTGPCGPCSEIHIDLTPDRSGASLVNKDDPRVIELWNLVFIQFSRGSDAVLTPLPAKHVDTGMGFERLCAVLQGQATGRLGAVTNYDTDVFTPIFKAIQKRTGAPAYRGTLPDPNRDREGANRDAERAIDTPDQVMVDVSYRVIADHVRCVTFALTDGAFPSNEGPGYVLRRILRRAVRYGRQYFDMHEPFLCDLVPTVVDHMAGTFPELRDAHNGKNLEHVTELLRDEEKSFGKTLDRGLRLASAVFVLCRASRNFSRLPTFNRQSLRALATKTFSEQTDVRTVTVEGWADLSPPEEAFEEIQQMGRLNTLIPDDVLDAIRERPAIVPGRIAFTLHDTYGFPIDMTAQMAEEQGLTVDIGEYERLMEQARERARSGAMSASAEIAFTIRGALTFSVDTDDSPKHVGLDCEAEIMAFGDANGLRQEPPLTEGQKAAVILNRTSFYAEQGGQVSDVGLITTDTGEVGVESVERRGEYLLHFGTVRRGEVSCGSRCRAAVNRLRRIPIMQNHTSTHIMNWALREVLGDHVQQKGSLVDPDKTRFDLSHPKPITAEELDRIERLCNEQIDAGHTVHTKVVDQKAALEINTLRAVFGEKYPDQVRVVSVGADIDEMLADPKNPRWMQYSVEFCGGTHLKNSAEAKRFVLIAEEGVAKGIRRVVGISGDKAEEAARIGTNLLEKVRALQGSDPSAPSRGLQPARTPTPEELTALQREIQEATIPVTVRYELRDHLAALQKVVKEQEKKDAADAGGAVMDKVAALLGDAGETSGVTVVVGDVPRAKPDALRGAIDWIRNKTTASAVLLVTAGDEKVTLIAGMSKDVVGRGVKAGDLIKEIAPLVGGRGGGRPDMAQGGGNDASGIPAAIDRAKEWITAKLSV